MLQRVEINAANTRRIAKEIRGSVLDAAKSNNRKTRSTFSSNGQLLYEVIMHLLGPRNSNAAQYRRLVQFCLPFRPRAMLPFPDRIAE